MKDNCPIIEMTQLLFNETIGAELLSTVNKLGLKSAGNVGHWGYYFIWLLYRPVTATLDWCEENYILSDYLAEMWNACSNIVFIMYAVMGIVSAYRTKSEIRFYLSYLSIMIVGIGILIITGLISGSFLFHGTLTYEMQLLDGIFF